MLRGRDSPPDRGWHLQRPGGSRIDPAPSRPLQVQHAISEKRVLEVLNHPFCNSLANVFSDPTPTGDVHLLIDVCMGGELFALLQLVKCFSFKPACFYASCVASALKYLHLQGIAYRDIKPENLVIDAVGYPKCGPFRPSSLRATEHSHSDL